MHNIEVEIMARRVERDLALSRRRLERARWLEELDSRADGAASLGRGGVLRDARRLVGAALRGRWLRTASRPAAVAGEAVALATKRVGLREA